MTVNVPIWVNDDTIGQLVITRDPPIPGYTGPWHIHTYRYEARQYEPAERVCRGRVQHKPEDGMWVLLAKVAADIPHWATPRRTVGP
jgi:hypothetical protein